MDLQLGHMRQIMEAAMAFEITFGKLLRAHRHSLGLTQAELASWVGRATITIRKIEADTLRPSVQVAERLAGVLDIPPGERADFVRLARMSRFNTSRVASIPTLTPSQSNPCEEGTK